MASHEMDMSDVSSQILLLSNISTEIKEVKALAVRISERAAEKGTVESMGYAMARALEQLGASVDKCVSLQHMADKNARVLQRANHDVHQHRVEQLEQIYRETTTRQQSIDLQLAEIKGLALSNTVPVAGGSLPMPVDAQILPNGELFFTSSYVVKGKLVRYKGVREDAFDGAVKWAKPKAWQLTVAALSLSAGAVARWYHSIANWVHHLGGK